MADINLMPFAVIKIEPQDDEDPHVSNNLSPTLTGSPNYAINSQAVNSLSRGGEHNFFNNASELRVDNETNSQEGYTNSFNHVVITNAPIDLGSVEPVMVFKSEIGDEIRPLNDDFEAVKGNCEKDVLNPDQFESNCKSEVSEFGLTSLKGSSGFVVKQEESPLNGSDTQFHDGQEINDEICAVFAAIQEPFDIEIIPRDLYFDHRKKTAGEKRKTEPKEAPANIAKEQKANKSSTRKNLKTKLSTNLRKKLIKNSGIGKTNGNKRSIGNGIIRKRNTEKTAVKKKRSTPIKETEKARSCNKEVKETNPAECASNSSKKQRNGKQSQERTEKKKSPSSEDNDSLEKQSPSVKALKSMDNTKETFPCETCDKVFKRHVDRRNHMRSHTGEKPYLCNICGRGFTMVGNRNSHVALHSTKKEYKPQYKCRLCKVLFFEESDFQKHRSKKCCKELHQCKVCGRCFVSNDELNTHKHELEAEFFCFVCFKEFENGGDLLKHVDEHTNGKPFYCTICHKSLKYAKYFIKHMQSHADDTLKVSKRHRKIIDSALGDDRYSFLKGPKGVPESDISVRLPCPVCGKVYLRTSLRAHMQVHSEATHQCNICGKLFKRQQSLKIHVATHADTLDFACEICGKQFRTKNTLRCHRLFHGEKKHTCEHCPKRFQRLFDKRKHMRNVHNVPSELAHTDYFACEVCGKHCRTKNALRTHKMFHGERKHMCEHCPFRFHRVYEKRTHMRNVHNVLMISRSGLTQAKEDG